MTKNLISELETFSDINIFLKETQEKGLIISSRKFIPQESLSLRPCPLLKNYLVDDSIDSLIQHNLEWANTKREKPIFKFAYLMLPTICNQKCIGCFTGKDKGKLHSKLSGDFYTDNTIKDITSFLKDHGANTLVYAGGGELFTWEKSFDYINQIIDSGLSMVIFTNGSLLSENDIKWLSEKDISLIFSFRDTTELDHDIITKSKNGFRKTLQALDYALKYGINKENRLAAEIPVTKYNQERVLYDFIPAMRTLGIIPMIEEFILKEIFPDSNLYHDFTDAREFFIRMSELDRRFGYDFKPVDGQRMLAQPKCKRPLYSFTIYPSGDVTDCPSNGVNYGNFYKTSLKDIVYSSRFKESLRQHQYCHCSVFYTTDTISEKISERLGVKK